MHTHAEGMAPDRRDDERDRFTDENRRYLSYVINAPAREFHSKIVGADTQKRSLKKDTGAQNADDSNRFYRTVKEFSLFEHKK